MDKTVIIDGKPVPLRITGGTLRRYKEQFGVEYYNDNAAANTLEGNEKTRAVEAVGFRLIWALAKTADPKLPDPLTWIGSFGKFPLDEIISEATGLVNDALNCIKISEGTSGRPFTSENLMASCLICGLSAEDADNISLGFLINTINEYCRIRGGKGDENSYRPATQADYDAF